MPGCCTCTPAAWWGGSGMAAQLASANADAGGNVVASVRDPISPCSSPAFVRAQQRSLLCARGAHVSRGVQARLKRGAAPSASLRCGAGRLLEFIGGTGEGNHRAETEGRSIAVAVPGFAVAVFRSFDVQICGGFCSASGHPLATPGYQSQPRRYDCIRVLFSGPLLAFAPRPPPPPIEVHHPARGRSQSQSQPDVCRLRPRSDVSWTSGSTQCQCSCSAVVNCSGRRAPARRSLAPLASDHFSVCALARHARFPARATRCARARGDRDPVRP